MRDKEDNPYNIYDAVGAVSTMDCTGLIPSLPEDEAEIESYEELYPFMPTPGMVPGEAPSFSDRREKENAKYPDGYDDAYE